MQVSTEIKDGYLIARIKGELDMETVDKFKKKVISEMESENINNLILNFKETDFIDSTGLGAILGRYRSLKDKGGNVILVDLNPRIKKVFSLSGILNTIPVYKTENTALKEGC